MNECFYDHHRITPHSTHAFCFGGVFFLLTHIYLNLGFLQFSSGVKEPGSWTEPTHKIHHVCTVLP